MSIEERNRADDEMWQRQEETISELRTELAAAKTLFESVDNKRMELFAELAELRALCAARLKIIAGLVGETDPSRYRRNATGSEGRFLPASREGIPAAAVHQTSPKEITCKFAS